MLAAYVAAYSLLASPTSPGVFAAPPTPATPASPFGLLFRFAAILALYVDWFIEHTYVTFRTSSSWHYTSMVNQVYQKTYLDTFLYCLDMVINKGLIFKTFFGEIVSSSVGLSALSELTKCEMNTDFFRQKLYLVIEGHQETG